MLKFRLAMLVAVGLLVAQVAIADVVVQNGGFEDPWIGYNNHQYTEPGDGAGPLPPVPGWTFCPTDVVGNTTHALSGYANGTTLDDIVGDGDANQQAAFIQFEGWIKQTINGLQDGTFSVGFDARQNFTHYGQTFEVKLDDTVLTTVTPILGDAMGSAMAHYTSPEITIAAGTHTLSFTGKGPVSAFGYLDNVTISGTSTPEPSTLVLMASGLVGLLAYAWRKRK